MGFLSPSYNWGEKELPRLSVAHQSSDLAQLLRQWCDLGSALNLFALQGLYIYIKNDNAQITLKIIEMIIYRKT